MYKLSLRKLSYFINPKSADAKHVLIDCHPALKCHALHEAEVYNPWTDAPEMLSNSEYLIPIG
jgi:hypothetical protein